MTWIIARIVGMGVPARFAKPLLTLVGVLLLVGALFALRACDKRNIIREHTAGQEAATAKADRKADAKAAEERRADDTRLVQEATQLEKVQANAKTDTDRRLARHHCLRLQQTARRDGREPPTCG